MSLNDRLADLERRLADNCPECGGDVPRAKLLPIGVDGTPAPIPGPCVTCGREPRVIRLRPIRFDTPNLIGEMQ